MSPATPRVFQSAVSLLPEERFELLEALIAAEQSPPAPIEDFWRQIVGRRSAEIESGAIKPHSWPEVRARMRQQVGLDG